MATLNLRRFTKVETLRAIKQELLVEFLLPYNNFFLSRGVSLEPQKDSEELLEHFVNFIKSGMEF